jgi:hypothetical protein
MNPLTEVGSSERSDGRKGLQLLNSLVRQLEQLAGIANAQPDPVAELGGRLVHRLGEKLPVLLAT